MSCHGCGKRSSGCVWNNKHYCWKCLNVILDRQDRQNKKLNKLNEERIKEENKKRFFPIII